MSKLLALKIKVKHLAAEARIIRKQELKMRGPNWGSHSNPLHLHRVQIVRPEARDTHIAYGYLKGKAYSEIEADPKSSPNWKNVGEMVKRFSDKLVVDVKRDLEVWRAQSAPSTTRGLSMISSASNSHQQSASM